MADEKLSISQAIKQTEESLQEDADFIDGKSINTIRLSMKFGSTRRHDRFSSDLGMILYDYKEAQKRYANKLEDLQDKLESLNKQVGLFEQP